MATYYDVLNVAPGSEDVVIRAAYRALMSKYHPDKFGDRERAERKSKLINEAYDVLGDPVRRARYDAWLQRQARAEARAKAGASHKASPPPQPPPPPPAGPSPASAHRPVSALLEEAAAGNGFALWWLVLAGPLLLVMLVPPASTNSAAPSTTDLGNDTMMDANATDMGMDAIVPPMDTNMIGRFDPAPELVEPRYTDQMFGPSSPSAAPSSVDTPRPPPPVAVSQGTTDLASYPDVSNLSREDVSTMRIACAGWRARGPAAYNRCLRSHMESLVAGNAFPDLSRVSREDQTSIRIACAGERSDGPARYNGCVRNHLSTIAGGDAWPDLSGVDREDLTSIRIACAGERSRGPADYNRCVRNQLASLTGKP